MGRPTLIGPLRKKTGNMYIRRFSAANIAIGIFNLRNPFSHLKLFKLCIQCHARVTLELRIFLRPSLRSKCRYFHACRLFIPPTFMYFQIVRMHMHIVHITHMHMHIMHMHIRKIMSSSSATRWSVSQDFNLCPFQTSYKTIYFLDKANLTYCGKTFSWLSEPWKEHLHATHFLH